MLLRNISIFVLFFALAAGLADSTNQVFAQRRGFQIGGPNGVVGGGGMGLRIGGQNGVQFGGGQGARFGPQGQGFQVGGGLGLQFGNWNTRGTGGYPAPGTYPGQIPNPPVAAGGNAPLANTPLLNAPATGPNIAAPRPTSAPVSPQVSPQVDTPKPAATAGVAPQQVATREKIVLKLSSDAKRPIEYTINGTPFQLSPGSSVVMDPGMTWKIGLNNRKSPDQTYDLVQPGRYTINRSDEGWVIDATNNNSLAAQKPVALAPAPPTESSSPTLTEPTPVARVPEIVKPAETPTPSADAPKTPETARPKSVLEFNRKSDKRP